jgi:superfamily II RNA helicase
VKRGCAQLEPADIASAFGFPLDEFQMDALTALAERRNVIVSAPTGSGKTVCGEAAVYLGSALGKRVIYTTPLKALSNQKYNDFCAQFGEERVGLLTGDTSINREQASILVVTTEVYRNMLYDVESIPDVHSVVLDEFHYMNDRDRGTVPPTCWDTLSCADWA